MGLVADTLAATVGSEPHGLVQHSLHGVDLGVVDGDRSDLLGQREPVGVAIDHHHLRGALDRRGQGGHQSHGAGPGDHDAVARDHAGHLGGVVAGGEDVGEHDVVVLLVLRVFTQAQRVVVAEGHPEQFCLPAAVRAHFGEAVGRTGGRRVRLRRQAVVREPALAVLAEPARDVEGQHDPVAHLDLLYSLADLHHLSHVLVAERPALLEGGPPLVHVQV